MRGHVQGRQRPQGHPQSPPPRHVMGVNVHAGGPSDREKLQHIGCARTLPSKYRRTQGLNCYLTLSFAAAPSAANDNRRTESSAEHTESSAVPRAHRAVLNDMAPCCILFHM